MNARRVRSICEHVYMLAVCAFLLWDVAYMTEAGFTRQLPQFFPGAILALAAGMLVMSRGRIGALWIPCVLLMWMTGVSAWYGSHVLAAEKQGLFNGLLAFAVIAPSAFVVQKERWGAYLRALLAAWTAAFALQAFIGLWAALSGHAVFSLRGTWYIGVNLGDNRLYMMAYVTTGAVKLGLSAVLAALGCCMARTRLARTAYILAAALQALCLSLTDCRTAFVALGAALGLLAAAAVLRRGKRESRRSMSGHAALAMLLAAALTVGCYAALSACVEALAPHVPHELDNINLLEVPGHMLGGAAAEEAAAETAATAIAHRELNRDDLFNGRSVIWRAVVRMLRSHPSFLRTGITTGMSRDWMNYYVDVPVDKTFSHAHSILLQTLVSWGVPGLVLLLLFLLLTGIASVRLLLRRDVPLWTALLPLPAAYVLICDTIDCFLLLRAGTPMLMWGCFFAGAALRFARREKTAEAKPLPEGAVDVIIPVYNAGAYLRRAVDSALASERVRVLLVDDGSTDGTADLCRELAENPRVQLAHQPNRGAAAARNAGLAMAEAPFVMFLDADDRLTPGAVEHLLAALGDADAVQGRICRAMHSRGRGRVTVRTGRDALLRALADPTRHLLCHGWLLRRELAVEPLDEGLSLGEDGEWMLRTLRRAALAAETDMPVYCYTVRADSALHGGGQGVAERYMDTLGRAKAALDELECPKEAALYTLTHLLLALTHGVCLGRDGAAERGQMAQLCRREPFAAAFAQSELAGLSPRMLTLRWLRRGHMHLAYMAVRARRGMNRLRAMAAR